jgi:hypothetical protein
MKTHRISGEVNLNATGYPYHYLVDAKEGFSWYAELTAIPLDAPDSISVGAMSRAEWECHIHEGQLNWYPYQQIMIRGLS